MNSRLVVRRADQGAVPSATEAPFRIADNGIHCGRCLHTLAHGQSNALQLMERYRLHLERCRGVPPQGVPLAAEPVTEPASPGSVAERVGPATVVALHRRARNTR